tara:strand:+ start:1661 stop:2710 length:1050 start_codon:yes stop_codon:yes gene_type:complete
MHYYRSYVIRKVLLRVFQLAISLTSIFMFIQIAEICGQIEGISTNFLILCVILSMPTVLVIVLTFVFPLGACWAVSQIRDSGEVMSMSILGISDWSILSWVMQCGMLGAMLVWLVVSVVEPISVANRSILIDNYSKKHIFSMLKPDTFQAQGKFVIYADDVHPNAHSLDHVFAAQRNEDNEWSIVIANKLKETKNGDIVLDEGEGSRFSIRENQKKSIVFSQALIYPYQFLNIDLSSKNDVKLKSFKHLWSERSNAEFLSRICWMTGLPSLCMILVLMAGFMMFDITRSRSSFSMIYFVATFIIAVLMIIFIQRQTQKGIIRSIDMAIVIPNLCLLCWVLLYRFIQRRT